MTETLPPDHLSDSVTKHMRREFTQLLARQTIGDALAGLREKPPAGRILYFYVVDDDGGLQGVVPTRRLLLNALDCRIADIMVGPVVAVPDTATVLDACEFFTLHRLLAFPVVDAQKRILGVVDVELYTDQLSTIETSESNDAMFQLIGVHLTEAQQASPLRAFRGRFPWLLCNIGGGLLAALLSFVYQDELAWRGAVLALFIPVVLALAESVSIQSVSLALQTLQVRRASWSMLGGKARQELLTGLCLGAGCGLLVALVSLVWLGEPAVALCLLGAIGGGVTLAAVVGFAMPVFLHLMRRDPQLAAGPIALALSDMLTLLLYFNLARWLLMASVAA